MKYELHDAFCGELVINELIGGVSVGTGFEKPDGDKFGFYVFGPDENGLFRIEDDGLTIPNLLSEGFDLSNKSRKKAFDSLLKEYDCDYSAEDKELYKDGLKEGSIGEAALRFVSLMLRSRGLLVLNRENVASTFREDAIALLEKELGGEFAFQLDVPVSNELKEFTADIVIKSVGSEKPVAVFLASGDAKLLDAMLLKMTVTYEHSMACSVVALIESDKKVSSRVRQKAMNRLNHLASYEGDELAAIRSIKNAASI